MDVNSLPETVTRQRRGCDLNPGPSAPESSTLTSRLPSHPSSHSKEVNLCTAPEAPIRTLTASLLPLVSYFENVSY